MVAAPRGKHGQWQKAEAITAGQYFKYYGKWYLAIMDAQQWTDRARPYECAIQAMNVDGVDEWVGIFPARHQGHGEDAVVEVPMPGKRPRPFTPATLRRKARAHEEEAARLRHASDIKLALARRLENGWLGA